MSKTVLDADALAQALSAARRRGEFSEPVLQLFIAGDADGPAGAWCRDRAAGANGAASACLGVELHHGARRESLGLARWTGNREVAHVDVEVALREERAVVRYPRFAKHLMALGEELGHQPAANVAAI